MRLSVVFIALFALALGQVQAENVHQRSFRILHQGPPPLEEESMSRATIATEWITQKLDNFNESDLRTWEMRYMANGEFFKSGGPLFIFVGGEWEISEGYLRAGHMYDMAREHNGYLFYTEHRYYGKSKPTADLSNENIKYLTVQQALADLAHFIKTMRATIPGMENSKAILVGGSYSATMVTWFKRLYPELAAGCWASSAPLLAKEDFYEYKEVTGESIKLIGGESCYNRIDIGIQVLEYMFERNRGAEVKAMLTLCSDFDETNDLDVWSLFSEISDIFAGVVQTHNSGTIEAACEQILDDSSDVNGLVKFLRKQFGSVKCVDLTYKTILKSMSGPEYTNDIMRQWTYQTCDAFGWYQTSRSKKQPFGTKFPVTLFETLCEDAYGSRFTGEFIKNQIEATNAYFGGLTPEVTNVYMTHGELDPWRAMGIQDPSQSTVVPLYAHCKDFDSISDKDTPEMRASKEKIAALVREWLK